MKINAMDNLPCCGRPAFMNLRVYDVGGKELQDVQSVDVDAGVVTVIDQPPRLSYVHGSMQVVTNDIRGRFKAICKCGAVTATPDKGGFTFL